MITELPTLKLQHGCVSTLMFAAFHNQSPLTIINYACNNELQKKFIVTDFKIKKKFLL